MARNREEVNDSEFRASLAEVLNTLVRLAPQCQDLDELIELVDLAVGDEQRPGNGAQLKILRAIISTPLPARSKT